MSFLKFRFVGIANKILEKGKQIRLYALIEKQLKKRKRDVSPALNVFTTE
jgi:hypothetical protein